MEQLLNQVKALSELELALFLHDLAEHIQKEQMDHLWTDAMSLDSYNELKSARDEMESELNAMETDMVLHKEAIKAIKSAIMGL